MIEIKNIFFRFPIAIKTPLSSCPEELDAILDEAKNMTRLEKYHDYIVNLQGLTCEVNKGNHHLSTVRKHFIDCFEVLYCIFLDTLPKSNTILFCY